MRSSTCPALRPCCAIAAVAAAAPALAQATRRRHRARRYPRRRARRIGRALKDARDADHAKAIRRRRSPSSTRCSRERPREPQARFLKGVAQTELGRRRRGDRQFQALTEDYPSCPSRTITWRCCMRRRASTTRARRARARDRRRSRLRDRHENLGDVYVAARRRGIRAGATLDKSNKSAPAKLKLVRDVLAVPHADTPPAAARRPRRSRHRHRRAKSQRHRSDAGVADASSHRSPLAAIAPRRRRSRIAANPQVELDTTRGQDPHRALPRRRAEDGRQLPRTT